MLCSRAWGLGISGFGVAACWGLWFKGLECRAWRFGVEVF